MLFKNPVIDTEVLPSIEEVEFQRLAPAYRKVLYISTLIFFLILLSGWALFYLLSEGISEWITMGSLAVLLVLFVTSMALVNSRYRMAGYALRMHDITYRSGVIWHSTTIVPYVRIQHVEISQGPVQSAFGIATLRIYTAGGLRSDLTIDGLDLKKASEIKEFITCKIGSEQLEEEAHPEVVLRSEEKSLQSEEKNLQSEEKSLRSEEQNLRSEEKSLQSEEKNLQSEEKSLRSEEQNLRSEEKEFKNGVGDDAPKDG